MSLAATVAEAVAASFGAAATAAAGGGDGGGCGRCSSSPLQSPERRCLFEQWLRTNFGLCLIYLRIESGKGNETKARLCVRVMAFFSLCRWRKIQNRKEGEKISESNRVSEQKYVA